MKNAIPDKYIFSCELFRNVERSAIADFGSSDIDVIKAVIIKKWRKSEISYFSNSTSKF